jgi:hypothetical protein
MNPIQSDDFGESARNAATEQHHSQFAQRSGRLKHGNPSGDPSQSPRCGARTRSGSPCRAPAMINRQGRYTRCRLHGGRSTGPVTAEGLDHSRRARLKHGWYSSERRERRRWVRAALHMLDAEINQAEVVVNEINRRNIAWYRAEIRKLKRLGGSRREYSASDNWNWFSEFVADELPIPLQAHRLMGPHVRALKNSYHRADQVISLARSSSTPDYIAIGKLLDRMQKISELLMKNVGGIGPERCAKIEWQSRRQLVLDRLR